MLVVLSQYVLGCFVMQQKLTDTEIISELIKVVSYFFTISVQNWQMVRKYNGGKIPFKTATLPPIYLKINVTRNRQDLYKENVKSLLGNINSC